MTLRTRILLLVTSLLVIAVAATAAILTWTARQSMLAQTEADGRVIAGLLARSASFADQVPRDVEEAVGEQMVVAAAITAHLVAVADAAGLRPDQIIAMLQDITERTVLDEFWITDANGHAYLRTEPDIDFTFSPDPAEQPQASVFWPLLTGEQTTVIQEAQRREVDNQIFKYVGVAGLDQPRIVQLGTNAELLERLAEEMGPARLADEIVAGGNVLAIRIVNRDLATTVFSAPAGAETDRGFGWDQAERDLRRVVAEGETISHRGASALHVAAPIIDQRGQVVGASLVSLPTIRVREAIRGNLVAAAVVAASVLLVGVLASIVLARWVTKPIARLTMAAAAVEAGTFEPESMAEVARRRDGLGQLARVFQRMAREVYAREQRLKAQVQELRIEIDRTREARQVAEITETDYFQSLQAKARTLRARPAPGGAAE